MKDAIVGRVHDQIRFRKEPRDRKARADGVLVDEELIVVPAETGVDGPISQADQILNVGRLLEIRTAAFCRETSGESEG